ncbi:hypothetical protein GBAR_LOCUS26742 [Geodia barretti]|uniref:Uncharacterized protein n=1 Tax=Geodia barretti TaxID=519541 RepID=A0AA35TI94_GEOBA|nr:hypothetical protein GBAR_LOCUS26742 [Geodia barretti]
MRWRSLVQDVLGVRAVRSGLWRSARQLSISLRRYRRLEDEAHEVRERLERNILRAGLRLMKGDRAALEENVRQRAVSVDLEKLYQLQSEYFGLNGHLQTLRQQRNINIHAQSKVMRGDGNEHVEKGRQLRDEIAELEVSHDCHVRSHDHMIPTGSEVGVGASDVPSGIPSSQHISPSLSCWRI